MTERVRLDRITKRYGSLLANDAVSLALEAGEIHALLGENGAGKSTLVKILYGLIAPDEGAIIVEGRAVAFTSPREARAAGIGMVFQHFSLFEEFSAIENIAVPLEGRIADDALRAELNDKATRFGLAVDLDRPVHTLSAGQRQRIEILRALMQNPRVLILDEPTSVLTPAEAEGLFATVEKLAADGAAILFISHKLEEVRRLCHRATILRGGKLVATADPRAISAREMAALMVGEGVGDIRETEHRPGNAMLELVDLNVSADALHGMALKDVSLTLRAGEILCVAGVAGNGQSELYAAISGEGGRITSGNVRMAGQDVTYDSISDRRRAGAAFVPEARLGQATLPQGTLSENVALSWHATEKLGGFFLKSSRLREIAADIIARFDVRVPSPDPKARQLSGGNLQKYVVGREIARKPAILVIDQPTWGVDARASQHIRQTLVDLAGEGMAILVISQDLDEVFEIADCIAVMNHGRLSAPVDARSATREAIGLMMTQHSEAA